MRWLEIRPSGLLAGQIKVQGSKNSSLGLLAACCLSDGSVSLENIPRISDTRVTLNILRSLGAYITENGNSIGINAGNITGSEIDPDFAGQIRTGYYFIGALLAKHKKVTVGYPGGDNFRVRPIDQHLKGFKAMGAEVELNKSTYTVSASSLKGADIYFDVKTTGGTINLMMAATLAKGTTVLYNAAKDPEIVDMAVFLNKMGARIYGAGTDTIRIAGVEGLRGCSHSAIPDRLAAGAFLMAVGAAGGIITLEGVEPVHLKACIDKLREIGMDISINDSSVTAAMNGRVRAVRVRAEKYPMFETDFQQPVTSLLLKAQGRSTISDRVFPHRFNHCEQLKRMGADIAVRRGVARINSFRRLSGTWVHADDIRAGISLVIAGLFAEGVTRITGVEHLERGYEDLEGDLRRLGADVTLRDSGEEKLATVKRY